MSTLPMFDPADPIHVKAVRAALAETYESDWTNVAASLRCTPTREAVLAALDEIAPTEEVGS